MGFFKQSEKELAAKTPRAALKREYERTELHAFAHLSEEDKRDKIEKLLEFIRRTDGEERRRI